MGLVYEFSSKEDLIYPIILCDHCDQQIADAKLGNVLWGKTAFEGSGPWRTSVIYFVHKQCDHEFKATHPGTYWDELSRFPVHLCYHLGMKDVAKHMAEEQAEARKPKQTPRKPRSKTTQSEN